MGEDAFDENLLTEKLAKLNSSQQSIESFSRWCISHRKKAKQVVERWDAVFKSANQEKRVSLLYLANDILQNSRRRGSEFVNEFWKVLPEALKGIYDSGDEICRKVASRLVGIWEERKVFGSKAHSLKHELAGKDPASGKNPSSATDRAPSKIPSPAENGKVLNPIKVVKRDANSLRIKLAVGGLPEKIITAFQLLHDEIVNEEAALNGCRNSVSSVRELEKDAVEVTSQGNQVGPEVMDNIQKQENVLQQSIAHLEKIEAARVTLFSQLQEAARDQESKLELIRHELLVARVQIEQAARTRLQLTSTSDPPRVAQVIVVPNHAPIPPANSLNPAPAVQHSAPLLNSTMSEEDSKRAAAAAVAAKLTASTSSAQMLTSVLSSLVAQEAASKSNGLKRHRLENPILYPDTKNLEGEHSAHFPTTLQAALAMPSIQSTQQSMPQLSQLQPPFLPPPPPPQLAPPTNSSANQMGQSVMMGLPYGYGGSNLQPPLLTSDHAMGFARPGPPSQQHVQLQSPQGQSQQPLQQQMPINGGYYRPVGAGFYGQNHQPATPPIHRQ